MINYNQIERPAGTELKVPAVIFHCREAVIALC